KLLVGSQTVGHLPHHPLGLQSADGLHRTGAGEVERGRERGAVLQARGGAHHQRPAAHAPGGHTDHAPGWSAELSGDHLQVTGAQLLSAHSSASPATCTESHTVRYQGPSCGTDTGPSSSSVGTSSPVTVCGSTTR